mmetsp:Transcript_11833/g.26437  ORF Transcript_11833/g.26437 Transcript_11833/m.26437 type:complete len:226 (+) Transcript_11833:1244-1921(+)
MVPVNSCNGNSPRKNAYSCLLGCSCLVYSRILRPASANLRPRLAANICATYWFAFTISDSLGGLMIGSVAHTLRIFLFLFPSDDFEMICFFVQLKFRFKGVVHRKMQSLMYSSMMGHTKHDAAISEANNVMRLGRYPVSRRTQGITGMGTLGAKEKMLGSNQLKISKRTTVVAMISEMKAHTKPTENDVKKVLIKALISFSLGATTNKHWMMGEMVASATSPRFS